MSTITLDGIKAEHAKLAAMIAAFEAAKVAAAPRTLEIPATTITLHPGERYAGLTLAEDGAALHHLILLPEEAGSVNWAEAKAWAEGQGGSLPTRREQSLLFANLKAQFEGAWYWSSEEYEGDASYAWYQYFIYGTQNYDGKSYAGRARAVRRFTA